MPDEDNDDFAKDVSLGTALELKLAGHPYANEHVDVVVEHPDDKFFKARIKHQFRGEE